MSVGDYQRLAHAAIDDVLAAGRAPARRRRHRALLPRRARRRSAAAAARAAGATTGATSTSASAPRRRTRCSPTRDPRAADARPRERPPARRARARARRSGRRRSRPPSDRLWTSDDAPADHRRRRSTSRSTELDRRIEAADTRDGRAGRGRGGTAAWAAGRSATARKVLGLEQFATLPARRGRRRGRRGDEAPRPLPAQVAAALTGVVTLDGDRAAEEIADEIVALAGAGERLPRH